MVMNTRVQNKNIKISIPEYGEFIIPHEFAIFTGTIESVEIHDSCESAEKLFNLLVMNKALVLKGSYPRANGIFRYCQHFERKLITDGKYSHIENPSQRSAAYTDERRQKLHRILLMMRDDSLLDIEKGPDTSGLQEWFQKPIEGNKYLIPIRRLQRILTDMKRAKEGIFINYLNDSITIYPHVYVPNDQSVPSMFLECKHLIDGKKVLDIGTGTGILALLAAKMGASKVTATDSNPNAVKNARCNIKKLGFDGIVDVKGPANLFDPLKGEKFHVIIFNAPWIKGEPQTLYDTANYDPGYKVIDGFMAKVRNYLDLNGVILIQYSDVSQRKGGDSINHLKKIIHDNNLYISGYKSLTRTSRVLGSKEEIFLFEVMAKK
ncbi:methyltransferase domain-containing protein [Candidatus Poribacteria bacterium]|nr:methyltransferase domain-containing protein [Candidatus Poribacteria bacterium]